jgi:hypothetical protein
LDEISEGSGKPGPFYFARDCVFYKEPLSPKKFGINDGRRGMLWMVRECNAIFERRFRLFTTRLTGAF